MVIKSCSDSQREILEAIEQLHVPGGRFEVDCTYGNGAFYEGRYQPQHCFDLQPLQPHVRLGTSVKLPFVDGEVSSIMFDPPFLTYVRAGRDGNGKMAMAKRFSGYWTYDELAEHYERTIEEGARVLSTGGVLVVKCQDIVHNHRLHATHVNVIRWGEAHGFRLLDLFVLSAKHRMPAPNRAGKQKHARIFHSYFVVLKRLDNVS